MLPAIGWPVVTAAVIGWSLGVAAWLRHHGWPIATAHLAAWAAPTALLAPLIAVGRLSPAGLILWGPVSALLAIALVATYDTRVVLLPTRAAVARDCVRHAARD